MPTNNQNQKSGFLRDASLFNESFNTYENYSTLMYNLETGCPEKAMEKAAKHVEFFDWTPSKEIVK